MSQPRRARLTKAGGSLAAAGIALLAVAGLANAGCDFDTMNHCAAFGVWPMEPFVLGGVTGLLIICGLAAGALGVILVLARLVASAAR